MRENSNRTSPDIHSIHRAAEQVSEHSQPWHPQNTQAEQRLTLGTPPHVEQRQLTRLPLLLSAARLLPSSLNFWTVTCWNPQCPQSLTRLQISSWLWSLKSVSSLWPLFKIWVQSIRFSGVKSLRCIIVLLLREPRMKKNCHCWIMTVYSQPELYWRSKDIIT